MPAIRRRRALGLGELGSGGRQSNAGTPQGQEAGYVGR